MPIPRRWFVGNQTRSAHRRAGSSRSRRSVSRDQSEAAEVARTGSTTKPTRSPAGVGPSAGPIEAEPVGAVAPRSAYPCVVLEPERLRRPKSGQGLAGHQRRQPTMARRGLDATTGVRTTLYATPACFTGNPKIELAQRRWRLVAKSHNANGALPADAPSTLPTSCRHRWPPLTTGGWLGSPSGLRLRTTGLIRRQSHRALAADPSSTAHHVSGRRGPMSAKYRTSARLSPAAGALRPSPQAGRRPGRRRVTCEHDAGVLAAARTVQPPAQLRSAARRRSRPTPSTGRP
ncbi:hypothetical protein SAMN05421812_1267 [Asanoa hainanensis]|uniref:Uncharacterized protein n=1 Tax=Asanoa hainanensis TaxID=560556 RepID=A0A239PGK9_9ACTN|nr:hypothetical protein SAMN05421812_1267 [Asanoa hainanensis]